MVVDGQVELEAKEPSQGDAAVPLGQPLEQLVPPDPWVMTDRQLGVIDKIPIFRPR